MMVRTSVMADRKREMRSKRNRGGRSFWLSKEREDEKIKRGDHVSCKPGWEEISVFLLFFSFHFFGLKKWA